VKTVILKKPIQIGESAPPIAELRFREELRAGDLRGIIIREEMRFDDVLTILGRLCGQPDVVMNGLSMEDFEEIGGVLGGFFGSSAHGPGGKTPSPS
jgi:hypothetical protein